MPEFAPEWAGSYLIAFQKASGGIRGIAPVDIWRSFTDLPDFISGFSGSRLGCV